VGGTKKKSVEEVSSLAAGEECSDVPAAHHDALGHSRLFLGLVVSAAARFRGARRVIARVLSTFQLPLAAPSGCTGRLWWLRVGSYKLTRAQEHADDGVWSVEHTVQLGREKGLMLLGVRLSALASSDDGLSHAQVEPIGLFPVTQSNGEVVCQPREQTLTRTGVPREIIRDHGSDVKAGIDELCQVHPETAHIYAMKQKAAHVLKHALPEDEAWRECCRLAAQPSNQVQQTSWAPLAPPKQRTKARDMPVDRLMEWGARMLVF